MSSLGGPNIITDGLVLSLDAANTKSYQSGSLVCNDLSGNKNSGSLINGPTFGTTNGVSCIKLDGVDDRIDVPKSLNGFTYNIQYIRITKH